MNANTTRSLDRRTRIDADMREVAAAAFFEAEFARLSGRHGALVRDAIDALGAPPLTIEVGRAAWTVTPCGDTIAVRPGPVEAALVIALSPSQFSEWVQNQVSLNGLMVMRSLDVRGGSLADVSSWDSIWTCLLEGWPVVGDAPAFTDRHGTPLDLARVFTPADDRADVQHFLAEAGYLHLRGWLDPADMPRLSADIDAALDGAVEGDGRSWWAQLRDGSRRCVRLQDFAAASAMTARILASERWADMVALVADGDELVPGRYVEALVKPVDVIAGPSDVSFHRDCHLGRHAYLCTRRTIGIAITPTGGANGSLRVIAGSHRLAMPVERAKSAPYLPVIAVATEPGDLTVHLSCTLHESTPPHHAERRVMYIEVPLAPLPGAAATGATLEEAIREAVSEGHAAGR